MGLIASNRLIAYIMRGQLQKKGWHLTPKMLRSMPVTVIIKLEVLFLWSQLHLPLDKHGDDYAVTLGLLFRVLQNRDMLNCLDYQIVN